MNARAQTSNGFASALKDAPLFLGYSDAELRGVARSCTRRAASRGEVLFRQDSEGGALFVLVHGVVKLTRRARGGRQQVIQLVYPGGSFGETVLFSSRRYPVNAVAIEHSDLVEIPAAPFVAFLRERPGLGWQMMEQLSRQLGECIAQIENLATKSVAQKVAAYLLTHSNGRGARGAVVRTGCPRTEIASLLSIRPETLSRTIREFRQREWIRVEEGDIVILDAQSLHGIVAEPREQAADSRRAGGR